MKPMNAPAATSCKKCCPRYILLIPVSNAKSKNRIWSNGLLNINASNANPVKAVKVWPLGNEFCCNSVSSKTILSLPCPRYESGLGHPFINTCLKSELINPPMENAKAETKIIRLLTNIVVTITKMMMSASPSLVKKVNKLSNTQLPD